MRARAVEVAEFDGSVTSAPRTCPRPATSAKNWSGLLGLAGTVILHGMVVHALLPGTTVHETKQVEPAGGGGVAPSAPEFVLIQPLDEPRVEDHSFVSLPMHVPAVRLLPLTLDRLPALNIPNIDGGDAESSAPMRASSGDPGIVALMYARYTGQISARIERAWMRPQAPVAGPGTQSRAGLRADDIFRCMVQIRQDNKGNVEEVLLLECNGTEAWRHSLVIAIDQSSPLPAPPIPSVFKHALTMTFEGRSDVEE